MDALLRVYECSRVQERVAYFVVASNHEREERQRGWCVW
uniref:Uncharacterized protein n=1 Tax=Anopheles quadriannulatus TaxID=34691 RepID=A0A182XRK2_ANOQN